MDGKEPLSVTQQSTMELSSATVYHIYHTGQEGASYSIHSISDSNAPLKLDTNQQVPQNVTDNDPLPAGEPTLRRESTLSRMSTKMKRAKVYDDPRHDPRTESSPYFVHLPKLAFHLPPYTLRHGGMKTAPVAALLNPGCGWREWKLEFGEVLSQSGVVDRRGVVNSRYGTKSGENGTLKGYGVRSFRWVGESGKAWFKEQKALGPQHVESTPLSPEEVVNLKWVAPISMRAREYRFNWRGFDFVWKGTGKAQAKKMFRPMLRFNHLKLVVLVPAGDEKESRMAEVVLARYTSVMASRKMGRLELDKLAIDAFLAENMVAINQADPSPHLNDEKLPHAEDSGQSSTEHILKRIQQRMNDLIVATGMGMIIGEHQKRQVIIGLILAALDGVPN